MERAHSLHANENRGSFYCSVKGRHDREGHMSWSATSTATGCALQGLATHQQRCHILYALIVDALSWANGDHFTSRKTGVRRSHIWLMTSSPTILTLAKCKLGGSLLISLPSHTFTKEWERCPSALVQLNIVIQHECLPGRAFFSFRNLT